MKKNILYLIAFSCLLSITACYKDIINCNCQQQNSISSNSEATSCVCPDDYYKLGVLKNKCEIEEASEAVYGACVEKAEDHFMFLHDCKCTPITTTDSLVIKFFDDGFNLETAKTSSTGLLGTYNRSENGNNFEFSFLPNIAPLELSSLDCEGEYYFGSTAYFSGTFNADNTLCETKIYFKVPSGTVLDSCNVRLVK